MDAVYGVAAALLFVLFFCGIGILLASAISGIIRLARRNEKPSDFIGGIAQSIVRDSDAWNYDANENWILSEKYALEISLQSGNYGCVNTRQPVNFGSRNIVKSLDGADRRAFCKAFDEWRSKTAIERQHRIERWKREALVAMAHSS